MSNFLETYVIHVTKKCNCNCLYCYEKDKISTYKWEEIKAFIDSIVENKTHSKFNIEFLGGEPMLEWNLIKESYEYMENIEGITVNKYIITGNGTILNDEIIDYLKVNPKICYAISLDGNKTANQLRVFKNNKNTYDVVAKNIRKIFENSLNFNVHMVTHPFNVGYIYESIYNLYSLGVRKIGVGIIESTMEVDDIYINKYIDELAKISDDIINNKLKGLEIFELICLKPKSDIRTYIKDDNGKIIGESYGRSGNDITSKNIYKMDKYLGDSSDIIYDMRKKVYDYHNNKLKIN